MNGKIENQNMINDLKCLGEFMKKKLFAVSLIFLLGCAGGCGASTQNANVDMSPKVVQPSADEIETLVDVRKAVVGIRADYNDGYAVGSGVAVVDGNIILTNNHVVEGTNDITLYFADETSAAADVLWTDAGLDVAVLKSKRQIPFLNFGDSASTQVGETVYAVGTPLTLQFKHSVTKGIVSAKDRVVEVASDYGDSFMQSLIQHDASINPGNSGGPLVNSQGTIVGINTLKASEGEGIGFAIPIEIGEKIANRLKTNKDYQVPYIGVFGFDSEIAKVYGYEIEQKGVYVIDATGASSQILQKGDVVISFGGERVEKLLDLRLALFDFDVGDVVEVTFLRNGNLQTKSLTLGKRQ